jgi:hypothetical protein
MSWESDMRAVHAEACGAMHLDLVQPGDFSRLVAASLMGSDAATFLIGAVEQALHGIKKAPRRSPMLCGNCPRPIRRGGEFWVAIASPARDDAQNCITLAICAQCATEREDARKLAMKSLRRIFPDAREITVQPTAGRA